MIYSDTLRQILLAGVGCTFALFALWAVFRPASLANTLGYTLSKPNGVSEFGAIYIGVFTAQALLCALAFMRISDATLGDLTAIFLLLQPVGRLIPLLHSGMPTGLLRLLFAMEVIGGVMLLLVRPT